MEPKIIFFDGVCNLCNGFVDFVIDRDGGIHKFASLQGETAQKILGERAIVLDSVILWSDGKILEKSSAALSIANEMGFPWALSGIFWLVPRFLRDWVYDFVAKNRYRFFGKRETCRLPTPGEKARFLD